MKYASKYTFLLAALVTFLLSVGFYFLDKTTQPEEMYVQRVQERLGRRVQEAQETMRQVVARLQTTPDDSFGSLYQTSPFPYYVFKNGQLRAWSEYRLVPDFAQLASYPTPHLIELPQGKFILLREVVSRGGSRYDLFLLITVYRHYKSENSYLQSGYDPAIFPLVPLALHADPTVGKQVVYGPGERPLFSIELPASTVSGRSAASFRSLLLGVLSALLLGVYVLLSVRQLGRRRRYGLGFALLGGYLVLMRGLMLRFSIPFSLTGGAVFDPSYYHASSLAPSLGDLLLNTLVVMLLLIYLASIYFRTTPFQRLIRLSPHGKTVLSFGLIVGSYGVFYGYFQQLISIYEKFSFSLDLPLKLSFNALKATSLLVFLLLSSIYFLLVHLLVVFYIRLNKQLLPGVLLLLAATLLTWAVGYALGVRLEWVLLLHAFYMLVLYVSRLPRSFYGFRYPTTLYYFLGAFVCAFVTTCVVHQQEMQQDMQQKKAFGQSLLREDDPFTEYSLKNAQASIAADADIQAIFMQRPPLSRELIQQKVRSYHLDRYLDRYEVEITSFDAQGQPLDNRSEVPDYALYQRQFQKSAYATEYPDVFFVNGARAEVGRQYVCFVPVRREASSLGYVVLHCKQTRDVPQGTYPKLFLDKRFVPAPETREYSYALYGSLQRLYSYGAYNYERKFPVQLLHDSTLYRTGISLHHYRHIGERGPHDRQVVVSSKEWTWKGVLANFSFLYLNLVVFAGLVLIGHAINYNLSPLKLTYSTKLQVLLNSAFIVPLFIVLFVVLKVIADHYEENQGSTYLTSTQNFSATILNYLQEVEKGRMSNAYLQQELQRMAQDADLDINVYDPQGRLLAASKPLIFQNGLLAPYLNPDAYRRIIEEKDSEVLLRESLGTQLYTTTYVGVSTSAQHLLGVVSVPYFDSQSELDRQIIDIVASVLIIFTGMLLVFLAVSYFASNLLLTPLRVLTRKLGHTNLNKLNQPLEWRSRDEIGSLIRQYNRMLVNLEENKQALSASEKQSAWREMAKQVAHEIKNPLTPMKLTLQQLQRTVRRDDPQALEKVGKAIESIIEQIDNIGQIAQSFSDIAKMPLPQKEVFEVSSVLEKASNLYASDSKITLKRDIQAGPIYIQGDRQQFGASITNLILNAIQSVPDTRRPTIGIKLTTHDDDVLIEISDNGSGIPQNIRSRVFLPNFTTREGGSGLGLAIAKRIIEHAGGSIWFETEEGVGTTFHVSIPLASEEGPSEPED